MPKIDDKPEGIKAYEFHGLEFTKDTDKDDWIGICPFCGREKFSVNINNHFGRCWACNVGNVKGGMNPTTFIREVHARSITTTTKADYEELAHERGLLYPETLKELAIVKSFITNRWLVPGYNIDKKMTGLYQYISIYNAEKKKHQKLLLPTPTLGAHLFGMNVWESRRKTAFLIEGPWDLAAIYELLGKVTMTTKLSKTKSINSSLRMTTNVVGIPGCGNWSTSWNKLFLEVDTVATMFDNDHERLTKDGRVQLPPGYTNTRRTIQLLAELPVRLRYLKWADEEQEEQRFNKDLPDGCDARDILSGKPFKDNNDNLDKRIPQLEYLINKVVEVPDEWRTEAARENRRAKGLLVIDPTDCSEFERVRDAWADAMRWRDDLERVLITMLAVCMSTEQIGDQLFLQIIGDAGSGKTKFCDALLISKYCYPIEHLTGFHSGYKGDGGKGYSLIDRINRKTLVTPEGDTIISSPKFAEIMSQQRRIFDGTSGASYKNKLEDDRQTGLRTPWIMAGTPELMLNSDQSRLGDRFLKVFINTPDTEERRAILRSVGKTALANVKIKSSSEADKQLDPKTLKAYQLTGGYINYLRENVEEILGKIEVDEDYVLGFSSFLGEYAADLRARPSKKEEAHDNKELPTRLTHQLVRMSLCVAGVLQKENVDNEVLAITKQVGLDTSRGVTADIVQFLYKRENGAELPELIDRVSRSEETVDKLLKFMKNLDILDFKSPPKKLNSFMPTYNAPPRWMLSERMKELCEEVNKL